MDYFTFDESGLRFAVPKLQPTETIESAVLRVARVNGRVSADSFREAFWTAVCCAGGMQPTIPDASSDAILLATLGQTPPIRVVAEHTLAPAAQAFCKTFSLHRIHGRPRLHLNPIPKWIQCERTRYCPECLKEDMAYHKFPFLRRHHQLHGVASCSKHEKPLIEYLVPRYSGLPSDASIPRERVSSWEASRSPIALRYQQVMEDLLHRKEPICIAHATKRLQMDLAGCNTEPEQLELDHVRRFVAEMERRNDPDANWARSLLCSSGSLALGERLLVTLTGQCTQAHAVVAVALLIYQDADIALHRLMYPAVQMQFEKRKLRLDGHGSFEAAVESARPTGESTWKEFRTDVPPSVESLVDRRRGQQKFIKNHPRPTTKVRRLLQAYN